MSEKIFEINIFGRGKINLRQLVIFNCEPATSTADQSVADFIEIARAYRNDTAVNLEDCNITANYFAPTKSLHLNGIFLTEKFGLNLRFKDSAGSFALEKLTESHPLMEILTTAGKEVSILAYAEGAPIA